MASKVSLGLKRILQGGSTTYAEELQEESLLSLLLCIEEKLILSLYGLGRPSTQGALMK